MKSGELAKFTADAFFEHVPRSTRKELLARLRLLFDRVLARATAYELQQLDALVAQARAQRAPPSGLVDWLRERGGTEALVDFVTARVDEAPRVSRIVDSMITGAANRRRLLEAAIRLGAGRPDHGDDALIQQAFDEARHKESAMGTLTLTFTFDPRGLPVSFDQAAFLARVNQLLATTFGLPPAGNENTYAAIMGILLLNEQTDQGAVTFRDAVGEAWNETLVEVLDTPKTATTPEVRVSSRVAYDRIAAVLATTQNLLPIDPATELPTISFQQFASTARFVISKADDVFLSHPNLPAQIRIGLDQYVAGPPLFEALDLPPLGDDAQIVDDNVRSVGIVAACYFLERTRILDVLDAITSEFVVGKVPIGFDSAGRALDDYRTSRASGC